jgi:hypothetical protein
MSNLWVDVEELGDYADSDYAYEAVKTASHILWSLSGRKFSGSTTVTERYTSAFDPYLRGDGGRLSHAPILINGSVENFPMGGSFRNFYHDIMGDGTSSQTRVRLRGRKVVEIHSLRDDKGNIISPDTYYLGDHSTIYGTPNANWTSANVEVTYTYGTPPPASGRAAARILASELVKLYANDDTCALPQRVTSIVRQGVTYTVLDQQSFIDELKTGIYAIDLFLRAVNPDKARARSRVFSPDTPRARRIIGKSPAFELSSFDLYFNQDGGTQVYYLNEFGGDFLADDSSWSVYAIVANYSSSITKNFTNEVQLDAVDGTIRVSIGYNDLLSILGPRDPGLIDIYATRPSLGNPEVDEVINLVTGNVIYQLGDRVTPIVIA